MPGTGQFASIATDAIRPELNSTVFNQHPLLAVMTGKARQMGRLMRPGVISELRKSNRISAKRLRQLGTELARVRYHKNVQAGKKNMGRGTTTGSPPAAGTTPTVTNQNIMDSMLFGWTKTLVPIEIPDADITINSGAGGIGNVIKDYTDSAVEDTNTEHSSDLYTGFPTSQTPTNDFWDNQVGLKFALYDGTTTATGYTAATHKVYGTQDKAAAGNERLKPAKFDATARQFSFDLIDQIQASGPAKKGTGIDLALVNTTLFYNKVVKLAKTEGAQQIKAGEELPQLGLVGFMRDGVMYRSTFITHDPGLPAGSEGGTSMLFGLTSDTWVYEIHPEGDFEVTDLKWIGAEGGKQDVWQGFVKIIWRMYCRKPELNGMYSDVS